MLAHIISSRSVVFHWLRVSIIAGCPQGKSSLYPAFELLGPTKLFHVHVQDTSLNDVSPHCFNQLIQNQVAGMSIQSHLNFRCHIFPISIAAGQEV